MANQVEIGWRTQLTTETRPWAIDFAPEMDVGDVVGATTATLTNLLTGANYPGGLSGSPSVVGTVVTQTVTALVAGVNYRLVLTANMGGAKTTATALLLNCPY